MDFDELDDGGDGGPLDWDRDGDFDAFDMAVTHHAYELESEPAAARRAAGGACCIVPAVLSGLALAAACAASAAMLRRRCLLPRGTLLGFVVAQQCLASTLPLPPARDIRGVR